MNGGLDRGSGLVIAVAAAAGVAVGAGLAALLIGVLLLVGGVWAAGAAVVVIVTAASVTTVVGVRAGARGGVGSAPWPSDAPCGLDGASSGAWSGEAARGEQSARDGQDVDL